MSHMRSASRPYRGNGAGRLDTGPEQLAKMWLGQPTPPHLPHSATLTPFYRCIVMAGWYSDSRERTGDAMRRIVGIIVAVAALAGASVAHSMSRPNPAPAVQMYHQESSIAAVHTGSGYRVVRASTSGTAK